MFNSDDMFPDTHARKNEPHAVSNELNNYLADCIRNNRKCAHCSYNHNDTCFFASECFRNNQKFYRDEDEELE